MEIEAAPYRRSAITVLGVKAVFYGSSFASLWLITNSLTLAAVGAYMFAVALFWFLSIPASWGQDQVAMIAAARSGPGDDERHALGGGLVATTVAGGGVTAALALAAAPLEAATDLPGLARLLLGAAAVPLLLALSSVFEAWYTGTGKVGRALTIPVLGHVTRVPVLAALFADGPDIADLVISELVAAALPVLAFAATTDWGGIRFRLPRMKALQEGSALMIAKVASDGARRLDLFLLGLLASGPAVGIYGVAARLAVAVDLGREVLQPAYTRSAGQSLASRDKTRVRRGYAEMRDLSMLAGLTALAALALFGRPLLRVFGGIDEGFPTLMVLACAGFVNVGFGANNHLLKLAGHYRDTMRIRVAMLAILLAANLALVPQFGAIGAAIATLIATSVTNSLFLVALRKREQIRTLGGRSLVVLVAGALLALAAAGGGSAIGCGLLLAALSFADAIRQRRQLGALLPALARKATDA